MWSNSSFFRFIRLLVECYLFFYMLWEKIKYLNCNLLFVMKIVPVTIDFYNITKIWKRSRMLLKKLYFIVLFAFRLMSIKYTLTCAQHMWACNTTWNINNKNAHLSTQDYFLKKIHCCHSLKEDAEENLFLIIALKQLKLIINIIAYTSMMKKIILRFIFY